MTICEDFHGSTHEFFGQKWRALYQPPNKESAAQLYVQNVMSSLAIPGFQTVDIDWGMFLLGFPFPFDIFY